MKNLLAVTFIVVIPFIVLYMAYKWGLWGMLAIFLAFGCLFGTILGLSLHEKPQEEGDDDELHPPYTTW